MKNRTWLSLILAIIMVFSLFSCAEMKIKDDDPDKMTLEEQIEEAETIGYLVGVEFKRKQPDHVAEAADYTEKMLLGTNVIKSQDLINSGIKLYLSENPEAGLYWFAFNRSLRALGYRLPSINVLETSGLDISTINTEILNAFLAGFLNGLTGKVALEGKFIKKVRKDGTVVYVSPNQQNAVRGE